MKLVLIGHSVEDHIFYNGKETVKAGGLYYSAKGLLEIKDKEDEIFLITALDENNYFLFSSIYDKMDTSFSEKGKDIISKVRLDIYDNKERDERYDKIGKHLPVPDTFPFIPDGILINMITGFDLLPEQLTRLRMNYNCPIFMDVHSLSRGVDESMHRPQHLIPDFSIWSENLDIIQTNNTEIFSLYDLNSEAGIARRVLSGNAKCLIVTKGSKGAGIYYKQDNEMIYIFNSSLKVNAKNTVGSGDIFGAVFFYTFIKFKDVIKSLSLANKAAGLISAYGNIGNLSELK